MSEIDARLADMGLMLPPPFPLPAGLRLPFDAVQVDGTRVFFSGHGPQGADGLMAPPFGKLGSDLTVAEGYQSARFVALSVLASLKRSIGDLDRIRRWHRVFGMVNSAPGFIEQPSVINGFSDLIISLYGPERGAHTRSAVGMAELPFNIPVEVEGELSLLP